MTCYPHFWSLAYPLRFGYQTEADPPLQGEIVGLGKSHSDAVIPAKAAIHGFWCKVIEAPSAEEQRSGCGPEFGIRNTFAASKVNARSRRLADMKAAPQLER